MRERDQQRIVNQINKQFSTHEKAINQTRSEIHQLNQTVASMHNYISSKQRVEEQIAVNAAAFGQMNAYLNVVIFSGYAGFFAIWSFTNEHLPEKATILTALLMGASLILFIAWEVLKSMLESMGIVKEYRLSFENLDPNEYENRRNVILVNNRKRQKFLLKVWPFVAILTVVLSLGSGGLLAYNFFANLFSFAPNWPI